MRTDKTKPKGKRTPEVRIIEGYEGLEAHPADVSADDLAFGRAKPIATAKPHESTADFKARLAAMNPKPASNTEERPCVRTPEDCGFYPPTRNKRATEAHSAPIEALRVIVSVKGGVVDVEEFPPNIIVEVRDYDTDGIDASALTDTPYGQAIVTEYRAQ